jgi:hypothetical protein
MASSGSVSLTLGPVMLDENRASFETAAARLPQDDDVSLRPSTALRHPEEAQSAVSKDAMTFMPLCYSHDQKPVF